MLDEKDEFNNYGDRYALFFSLLNHRSVYHAPDRLGGDTLDDHCDRVNHYGHIEAKNARSPEVNIILLVNGD
jgi:hypothetical protein